MSDLLVHSTKFDGSLHYRYPVTELQRSHDRLITYFQPGVPVVSYRGSWTSQKHMLSFFWRDRAYVLHVRWQSQWEPEFLYIDIATKTSWEDGTVRYIDLDLDLILRPEAAVHLDDEDEFELHRVKWNYPRKLVAECWAAVKEARRLLHACEEPFSVSMFDWRPEKALRL